MFSKATDLISPKDLADGVPEKAVMLTCHHRTQEVSMYAMITVFCIEIH